MHNFSRALIQVFKLQSYRVLVFALMTGIIILYSPSLGAYFNADDFNFLKFLHQNIRQLLAGQYWNEWFIGGVVNYAVFRPIGNLFWLVNYAAFGVEPFGYHFVTVMFHVVASLAAFSLSYLLTHNRIVAGMAAIIFAVMPVHAEAVAWIAANYDVLSGMYFLIAFIFYILYRRRQSVWFYIVALVAFGFGLASKETVLTLPLMLLVYDLFYHSHDGAQGWRVLMGYFPFAVILAIRFMFFGQGYRGFVFAPEGLWYYIDWNLVRVLDPLPEGFGELRLWILCCIAGLFLLSRSRRLISFSVIWLPITLIPTLVGGVTDRSFYIPSFGVALLLAISLNEFLIRKPMAVRNLGIASLVLLIVVYSASLYSRNQTFARASQVAQAIMQRVKELHPTIPRDSQLVFVGVPDAVPEGPPVFGVGLPDAMELLYQTPYVKVSKVSKFPLWLDNLDHTFFFQVDHRRVADRGDLIAALESRKRCANFSQVARHWDLTDDLQGWEPWNQLDAVKSGDGFLTVRSTGNDPFMASPLIDIPTLAMGDIEITMRVQTAQPIFEGEVYWMTSDQPDFFPTFRQSFSGPADGEFHTYQIDIPKSGTLFIGDHIVRLRLDPVAAPADVAIKSIQVNTHCAALQAERCVCDQ